MRAKHSLVSGSVTRQRPEGVRDEDHKDTKTARNSAQSGLSGNYQLRNSPTKLGQKPSF